ncbi:unnamed protein product [Cercopithifilaria johnstoni]|uniref:Fibronectin type-III domain-containing protein n=1 Tax=Cercopithifilaria johnstoni TaxID=2874296 RepID=A0A8J2LTT7_9BILA|nr:unnamed protein product [Cercopithifilaria johnstoni]
MGISMVGFTKDLLLSSVQQTDQGLYQCIVSNAIGERSMFIGLLVMAEVDSVITNLEIEWSSQLSGGSANSVPLRSVRCAPDNWCVAKCCSSNYIFFPRQNYTFQMSFFKTGAVGKITPLSEHVTTLSWDGVSQKAMELTISRSSEETLEISWDRPSIDVANGFIQKYVIEYYEDSEPTRQMKRRDILPNSTYCLLNGIKSDVIYRFRVIPVTRRGLPPDIYLKLNSNFTFIGYLVESVDKNFHPDIGSLPIDIEQRGRSVIIHWEEMWKTSNFTSQDPENQAVLIRYARSDISPLKEKAEEGLFINGAMNLTEKFDTSRTYQFCSRLYDGLFYGPDFCRIYRLPPTVFADIFSGLSSGNGLPRPVLCHNRKLFFDDDVNEDLLLSCEPSYEFGDAMRVTWDWPIDDHSADEFLVHYTLSDSIFPEDDRLVITDEAFADLPSLRSNTTYRVMIEPRNKMGGVKGSWFNCTTPILRQIPAPTGVIYEELNATAVRVSWNPIHPNPRWSTPVGYVIQVQSSSTSVSSVKDILVDGISAASYVITLQPNMLYTFQVAARSSTGDLGQHSSPYPFAPSHTGKSDGVDVKKTKIFPKSSREGILIGIVLIVGLLTLCFGGICAHLRLKRRKLEMGMNANAANRGINSSCNNNTNYEMESLITRRRSELIDTAESNGVWNAPSDTGMRNQLNLPNSISNEVEAIYLDTKGGEQGALPSGRDKYLRLLNDKEQQRFKECFLFNGLSRQSYVKNHISCRKKTRIVSQNEPFVIMAKKTNKLLDSKWMRAACGISDPWSGSLPSKKRLVGVDSLSTRATKACYLMTGHISISAFEISIMMPHILSKLTALSDVTQQSAISYIESLDQATSYTSLICPRSTSVQSLYEQNGFIKRRNSNVKTSAPITTSNYMIYPCNTHSSQSLTWYDAGSVESDCIMRLPRDASKKHGNSNKETTAFCCSSMPNLTDSGIVYDEMHSPHPPPLSPPSLVNKHLER